MIAGLEPGHHQISSKMRQIDNFLQAHLEAKLVRDEAIINETIENMSDHEFITECKKKFNGNKFI